MARPPHARRLLALARRRGVIRARDLDALAIPRVYLRRMVAGGRLAQVSRGLYRLADASISEHHALALAAVAVPQGVVCLLSALRFYGIGTQAPAEVWMALPRTTATPHIGYPPIRAVRMSGPAFTAGQTRHLIDGRPVPMTTPAKTIADCFKFRGTVGLDVALEALREALRAKTASIDEIWAAAQVCRVGRVIRPYLEATA